MLITIFVVRPREQDVGEIKIVEILHFEFGFT